MEVLTVLMLLLQSTETSDVVVGVESKRNNGDIGINFYFIPTVYIEKIKQGSISVNKIPQVKNNWEVLLRCKEKDFVVFKSFYVLQYLRQSLALFKRRAACVLLVSLLGKVKDALPCYESACAFLRNALLNKRLPPRPHAIAHGLPCASIKIAHAMFCIS